MHRLSRLGNFLVVAGFVFSLVVGILGSMFGLIGTQGLHGNEPFFSVLVGVTINLLVVHGIAGALGLLPVLNYLGLRAWWLGIVGFLLGAVMDGLLVTASVRTSDSSAGLVAWAASIFGMFFPIAGGVIGVGIATRAGRTQ